MDKLGKGGQATVYKAWDARFNKFVALKVYEANINNKYNVNFINDTIKETYLNFIKAFYF